MGFDILKVDIDFSDKARGMGHYQRQHSDSSAKGKIEINPAKIKEYLTNKLQREPTEKEFEIYLTRVIMHESTHAAHDDADPEFWNRPPEGPEYLAYQGMFPENPYLALKEFLKHPDTMDMDDFDNLSLLLGFGTGVKHKDTPEKIRKILTYVDRWARTGKQKIKLTKLELAARKQLKQWNKMKFPQNANQMLARYGNENRKFIHSLHQKPPGGN